MREPLRYRAKSTARDSYGEWVYGLPFYLNEEGFYHLCLALKEISLTNSGELSKDSYCQIDPSSLCAQSPLYANNGTQVYEGDIIAWEWWDGKTKLSNSPVFWSNILNQLCVRVNFDRLVPVTSDLSDNIEIIGNVFDKEIIDNE